VIIQLKVGKMKLYFITMFIASSLLFQQNWLHAQSSKTDYSSSNTNSSSINKSSSTNNTSSSSSSIFNSSSSFKSDNLQSSSKSSSISDFFSSKKSNPISGYINLPNLAGYEVISNITEKKYDKRQYVKAIDVTDGDRFKCTIEGKEATIRLYGIDAPEDGQPFFLESTNHFKQLLDGKNVKIKTVEYDSSGRAVSLVYADNINVNEAMVRSGAAWVNPQNCKLIFCSEWSYYQQIAKALKMSLWEEKEPIPPWEYMASMRR
jgi:endonuclease YncB( thermonuclease family)